MPQLLWMVKLLWSCNAEEWPIPAKKHHLANGLTAFTNWPADATIALLLFHGCNNEGGDWFQKPEEVAFLQAALARRIAIVAYSNPMHNGNFCWPSADGSHFEQVSAMIIHGTREILQAEAQILLSLVFVGASSGGSFACGPQALRMFRHATLSRLDAVI